MPQQGTVPILPLNRFDATFEDSWEPSYRRLLDMSYRQTSEEELQELARTVESEVASPSKTGVVGRAAKAVGQTALNVTTELPKAAKEAVKGAYQQLLGQTTQAMWGTGFYHDQASRMLWFSGEDRRIPLGSYDQIREQRAKELYDFSLRDIEEKLGPAGASLLGNLAHGVGYYTPVFLPMMRVLHAAKLAPVLGTVKSALLAGAMADAVSNPDLSHDNLANLVQGFLPDEQQKLVAWLAIQDDDDSTVKRAKNALTSALGGATLMGGGALLGKLGREAVEGLVQNKMRPGAIRFGRQRVESEGYRGFITREGQDIAASPEGHQFTNAPVGALRYRVLEDSDSIRAFFDVPDQISVQQYQNILRQSRDATEAIFDLPNAPARANSLAEVRTLLSPYVEKEPPELASIIAKTHAESGGSTISMTGQNLAGSEGYAVGMFKNLERVFDHPPTPTEVEQYIREVQPIIQAQLAGGKRQARPRLTVGTWENEGKHYLDVSAVIPNYDRAIQLGVENKQKAIFDLKNMVETPVPQDLAALESEADTLIAQRAALGHREFEQQTGIPGTSVGAAASKLGPGGTVEMNRVMERVRDRVPNLQKAIDFFHAGEFNRDWYQGVREELERHFGDKAEVVAKLIAATSPKTDPKDNFALTLRILNQVAGKDTSRWTMEKWAKVASNAGVIYPRVFAPNIAAAIQGGELSGLKVRNFAKALMGDPNAVTVDAWITRFYLGSERRPGAPGSGFGINKSEYALIRSRIISGANALNVPPAEFQAAIWSAKKMISDPKVVAALDKGARPEDALPKMADTIRQGMKDAHSKGLLSDKATAAMKITMALAVMIAQGRVQGD